MFRSKVDNFIKRFEKKFVVQNKILIFRENLKQNLEIFRNLLPDKHIWIVLKSNAYGHGIVQVAEVCKNLDIEYLIVDGYFEALKVWKVSPKQKVLTIGYIDPVNLKNLDLKKVALTVYDKESIQELGRIGRKVKIHLKINTGMNRQGIEPCEIGEYLKEVVKYKNIELEGLLSHLANADENNDEFTDKQEEVFCDVLDKVQRSGFSPKFIHLGATAGSLKTKDIRINTIRLGLGFYGHNPYQETDKKFELLKDLKPALRMESRIVKTRRVKSGEKISYNLTHEVKNDTNIAVLPLGYYEGLNRKLSNIGFVKFRNKFFPIMGRVCMNLTIINTGEESLEIGSRVIVVSEINSDKNSVENICKDAQTIPHRFLVELSESVRREIRN